MNDAQVLKAADSSRKSLFAADGATRAEDTAKSHLAAVGLQKSYRKGRVEIPVLRGVDLGVRRGA